MKRFCYILFFLSIYSETFSQGCYYSLGFDYIKRSPIQGSGRNGYYHYDPAFNKAFDFSFSFGKEFKKIDWNISAGYHQLNMKIHASQHGDHASFGQNSSYFWTTDYLLNYSEIKRGLEIRSEIGFIFRFFKKNKINWNLIPTFSLGTQFYFLSKVTEDVTVYYYNNNPTYGKASSLMTFYDYNYPISLILKSEVKYKNYSFCLLAGFRKYKYDTYLFGNNGYEKTRFAGVRLLYYFNDVPSKNQ